MITLSNGRAFGLLTMIALFLAGCGTVEQQGPLTDEVEIHLQEYFHDNQVRIELDGDVIFDAKVSSNRAGLAETMELQLAHGGHSLRVWVDGVERGSGTFQVSGPLYVGIGYDWHGDQGIELEVRNTPFGYV